MTPQKRLRRLRASWRDTMLLFNEFRQPLLVFTLAELTFGGLYYIIAQQHSQGINSLAEAIYLVLGLTFLQPAGDFPDYFVLQLFYFLMPVVGIATLAQGLADFGALLFNRRARSKEWEMAVASTLSNHHILVGLGHLGYRIALQLHEMGEDVAVVEVNPSADLSETIKRLGIPVISDDASRDSVLDSLNIPQARSVILCIQNDALNLKIALKCRSRNPNIQVVIRIFDEDFAQALHDQFGFTALSATSMAAPAFAAAAAGADVTRPIMVENEPLSLARLTVTSKSRLAKMTVGEVEDRYNVNIILLKRHNAPDMQPENTRLLETGDHLAVLGNPKEIGILVHDNQ